MMRALVAIKIDCGYAGVHHLFETDLSPEQWNGLTEEERDNIKREAIGNYIDAYPVICNDEGENEDNSVELK